MSRRIRIRGWLCRVERDEFGHWAVFIPYGDMELMARAANRDDAKYKAAWAIKRLKTDLPIEVGYKPLESKTPGFIRRSQRSNGAKEAHHAAG